MPGVEKDLQVIEEIFEASVLRSGFQPVTEANRVGIPGDEKGLRLGTIRLSWQQLPLRLSLIHPRTKINHVAF